MDISYEWIGKTKLSIAIEIIRINDRNIKIFTRNSFLKPQYRDFILN